MKIPINKAAAIRLTVANILNGVFPLSGDQAAPFTIRKTLNIPTKANKIPKTKHTIAPLFIPFVLFIVFVKRSYSSYKSAF